MHKRSPLIALILVTGLLLRIACARGELWLDEISSLQLAHSASSLWNLLLYTRSDNNHLLNSAWLYLVDDWAGDIWIFYRIPALLGSVLTVILLPAFLKGRPFVERFTTCLLVALSYIFILYGSEARGYGLMFGLGVSALVVSERSYVTARLRSIALLFWVTCILGFLSQFTFLNFYLPLLVSNLWLVFKSRFSRASLTHLGILHGPVLCTIGFIYLMYVRTLPSGSGELRSYFEVIINLLSVGFGGPELSPSNLTATVCGAIVALLAVSILVIELISLVREKASQSAILLLGLVVPLVGILFVEPRVLYERYLLAPLFFAYLLFASFVSRIWHTSLGGKILGTFFIFAIVCGNARLTLKLLEVGRGEYQEAIAYIKANANISKINVSGDHEFRNLTVVDFYQSRVGGEQAVRYVPQVDSSTSWYLVHSQDSNFLPSETVEFSPQTQFRLVQSYDSAALSGWRWFLYHAD